MEVRQTIEQAIVSALRQLGVADPAVVLDYPADMAHGDYASNVAMMYAKELKTNPRALAEQLVQAIDKIDGVSKIDIAGPGFINFTLTYETITTAINRSSAQGDAWGRGTAYAGQEIVVEYTDPNPFKVLHIGHLMSNAIGESIARLCMHAGAVVRRVNYQGDVGMHVAKALWGVRTLGVDPHDADALGQAYAAGAAAFEDNPGAKTEITDINKKIYEHSDADLNTLYDTGRAASLAAFEEVYALLGTQFDHYFFESVVGPRGVALVRAHPEVFPESDGARVFRGEEYGLHTRVFINNKGLPTYEAKELGLAQEKMTTYPNANMLVVVTGNEITEYFKVVKKAMELVIPVLEGKVAHVPHGMLRLTSGKMSSRTGSIIAGKDLIEDMAAAARERAGNAVETPDTAIAVAAIKFTILKSAPQRDVVFDPDVALSLEGDSGPYLQYTHARCMSIIEKSKSIASGQGDSLTTGEPTEVERLIIRFPDIVARAAREYAPQHVAQYLLELASAFNRFYANEHILDGTPAQTHKVAITKAVQTTLKNGLWVLGITAPDKM